MPTSEFADQQIDIESSDQSRPARTTHAHLSRAGHVRSSSQEAMQWFVRIHRPGGRGARHRPRPRFEGSRVVSPLPPACVLRPVALSFVRQLEWASAEARKIQRPKFERCALSCPVFSPHSCRQKHDATATDLSESRCTASVDTAVDTLHLSVKPSDTLASCGRT